jgi:hypothetical protein
MRPKKGSHQIKVRVVPNVQGLSRKLLASISDLPGLVWTSCQLAYLHDPTTVRSEWLYYWRASETVARRRALQQPVIAKSAEWDIHALEDTWAIIGQQCFQPGTESSARALPCISLRLPLDASFGNDLPRRNPPVNTRA